MKNFLIKLNNKHKFSLENLIQKYIVANHGGTRGVVLHVGGNFGQEAEIYDRSGFISVIWIEGYPKFAKILKKKIKYKNHHKLITAMISDRPNEIVNFSIASNTGSSTALKVTDSWKKTFKEINMVKQVKIKCVRLDYILKLHNLDGKINFLVLDVEGSELKVLTSLGYFIKNIKFALVEVSLRKNYFGGPLLTDIDNYFVKNKFKRIYIKTGPASGDALYKKCKYLGCREKLIMLCSAYLFVTLSFLRLTDLFQYFIHFVRGKFKL